MSRKLMYVVNVDWFFLSHRLSLAQAALKAGFEVHVAASVTDQLEYMELQGFVVHPLDLKRGKAGLFALLRNFLQIISILRREKPDVLHLVTIKPVLLGGLAARLTGIHSVVAAISGLGFVFVSRGFAASVRRLLIGLLYKLALGHRNIRVIFQNADDKGKIANLVSLENSNISIIKGSGVDLGKFSVRNSGEDDLLVVLPARMLKDKGVAEFVEAAKLLTERGVTPTSNARFVLVGDPDLDNPASISISEIQTWVQKGYVEHWGFCKNMEDVFARSALVVLPSYREGLPKVLIEAAACGRAVVTTDVPGCRDAIKPNITGLLVPVRDAFQLAKAIEKLLLDTDIRKQMGKAGRELAEQEFGIDKVVNSHLKIYYDLSVSDRCNS